MSPVVVTAVFTPAEGHDHELRSALAGALPAVHAEEGCLLYAIHDADDGSITMIEKWTSREALDAHAAGPAVVALNEAISGHVAHPPVVTTMTAIPVGGSAGTL
ncbi:putative quinol monooxygenase [Microbacterium testaceum]|uniref:Antibiotic biosynthesis monooxygenase n=1 Tax=Microbacterium testaceum TaxID=2033 RepID=A0A147F4B9_MICTE|nr:putative quinol monooxygenase [Microbacterium testaceum]KTS08936.1 antibiotic biosynthesis monooxygenase [Microbacterium testaceum]KTS89316.1 antibiotic biosynthesis monooxygenase [Microbacterium testaceum]